MSVMTDATSTIHEASVSYEFHPLANLFPLLDGEAFTALIQDIASQGLQEPLVLYDGKILDGRNRYRACLSARVAATTTEYTGADPLGFVVSKNIHRRHLTESQRAMIAANIATMRQGARTDPGSIEPRLSQEDAAHMLKVSVPSVKRAKKVQRDGALEIIDAVTEGQMTVSAAEQITVLPKAEQPAVLMEAQQKAVGGKSTATHIRSAIQRVHGGPLEAEPVPVAVADEEAPPEMPVAGEEPLQPDLPNGQATLFQPDDPKESVPSKAAMDLRQEIYGAYGNLGGVSSETACDLVTMAVAVADAGVPSETAVVVEPASLPLNGQTRPSTPPTLDERFQAALTSVETLEATLVAQSATEDLSRYGAVALALHEGTGRLRGLVTPPPAPQTLPLRGLDVLAQLQATLRMADFARLGGFEQMQGTSILQRLKKHGWVSQAVKGGPYTNLFEERSRCP